MINEIINIILNLAKNYIQPKKESQNWYNEPWTEDTAKQVSEPEKEIILSGAGFEDEIYHCPVEKKKITSPYGYRHLSGMKRQFHSGIDLQGNQKYAFAVVQSMVVKIKTYDRLHPFRWKYLGNRRFKRINVPRGRAWSPYVILESVHGDYRFKYTHGVELVKEGQVVNGGDNVIKLGNYGNSRLQHLHFEVHEKRGSKWVNIDPEKFLKDKGVL